jgi:hypothetical protein
MVEAYLFFLQQLKTFFLGDEGEAPLAAEHSLAARVDECFQTLRRALMVVVRLPAIDEESTQGRNYRGEFTSPTAVRIG